MLLIDILNGLNFAGIDFLPAMKAARERKRLLNPVLKRILRYAAEEPSAFHCRFSDAILFSSAYLLSEAQEPDFLELVQPLIDVDADPSLIGIHPEDSARLVALSIGTRLNEVTSIMVSGQDSAEFCTTVLEALTLVAHWFPERRHDVNSALLILIRSGALVRFEPEVRHTLVDCCSRLGASEFLLDLQVAIQRGELEDAEVAKAMERADYGKEKSVDLGDWAKTTRITAIDSYLQQYCSLFLAAELREESDEAESDPHALQIFNSVAAPSRNYLQRFLAISTTPEIVDICTRVLRFVLKSPESYRDNHLPTAITAAICIGSTAGNREFTEHLIAILCLDSDCLGSILGDDLTELCDWALAFSARNNPDLVRNLVTQPEVSGVTRAVVTDAIMHQAVLGYVSREEILQYLQDLISQRHEIGTLDWLWPDVAKIGAKLELDQLRPVFERMFDEGFFLDDDDEDYWNRESMAQLFENPDNDERKPAGHAPVDLLRLSAYEDDHQSVQNFLGRLEPPQMVAPD